MTVKELIEELKKHDQDMKVSYPYFEEEGIIGGYIPLTSLDMSMVVKIEKI